MPSQSTNYSFISRPTKLCTGNGKRKTDKREEISHIHENVHVDLFPTVTIVSVLTFLATLNLLHMHVLEAL